MKYLSPRYQNTSNSLWAGFEDFFNAPSPLMQSFSTLLNTNPASNRPVIDLYEDDSNYYVQAELPGFNRKEIEVELENDRLILKGKRKEKGNDGKSEVSFNRSVSIPNSVKTDKVAANYVNGVLTITIPKAEAVKPLRIEVKS